MLRASRFLFLLGCAFALLATPAAAANTTEPKVPAPLGFDIYGSEFAFVSNDGWDLANGGPAKEVVTYRKKSPGAQDAYNRQDQMYIWARTCTPAAQKVVFTRTYDMPGVPTSFNGTLWATNSGYQQGPSQGIVNVKVFINGELLVTANGSKVTNDTTGFVIPTNPNDAKLFRKGINRIRIEVNKRAQSGSLNRCMYNTIPLGLRFALYGKFSADLFLRALTRNTYWRFDTWPPVVTVQENSFINNYGIRNRGPADAHFGRFSVTIGSMHTSKVVISNLTSSKGPCAKTVRTQSATVDCAMNDMPVGGPHSGPRYRVNLHFGPLNYAAVYFNSTISSRLTDPMFTNNQRQEYIHICGPGSTAIIPECANAVYPPPLSAVTDAPRAPQ